MFLGKELFINDLMNSPSELSRFMLEMLEPLETPFKGVSSTRGNFTGSPRELGFVGMFG